MSVFKSVAPLALLAASMSCYKTPSASPDSDTRSLDNFVKQTNGEDVTLNACGIAYDGTQELPAHVKAMTAVIDTKSVSARQAVLGALVGVPKPLLAPFVAAGGRIEARADAVAACKGAALSFEEKAFAGGADAVPSCWLQDKKGGPPRIVVSTDPALVRHALLRLFAYVHTELFVGRLTEGKAPYDGYQWREAVGGFEATRTALAAAFLSDLRGTAVHGKLVQFQARDKVRFGNYVYAEALDSYYCSKSARAVFEEEFDATWLVFTDDGNEHAPLRQLGR